MKRSEIWLISLDPTIGAEIKKTRPAIIVNDDELGLLPLRVIIPLTDWKDKYSIASWMVKVESNDSTNLTKTSSADCFQVRSVSKNRFIKKIGKIDEANRKIISCCTFDKTKYTRRVKIQLCKIYYHALR